MGLHRSRVASLVSLEAVVGTLHRCVEAATLAPSVHNTQPWRFALRLDLGHGAVDVYGDPARQVPVIDPLGRALHISCGAALLNLRVTAAALGWHVQVRRLPDPDDPTHLATVSLVAPRRTTHEDTRLLDAMPRRHTSREPFADRPLPESVRERLTEAARAEDAALQFLDGDDAEAVLSLVRTADARQRRDPDYRAELRAWTRDAAADAADDGVPASAYGSWSVMETVPLRDFGVGRPVLRRVRRYEGEPTLALLSTAGDDPVAWLRAGEALERVWLDATAGGLAMTPMTQVLEVPELRQLLTERWPLSAPQVVLRVGFGPPGAPSRRRAVEDVLVR